MNQQERRDETSIRHVLVRGLVQGVGFRAFVERHALARGLEGWTRNRRDGSVEALFRGPAAEVAAMIGDLRRGPRHARVDRVEEQDADASELAMRHAGDAFSVLPTV